MTPAVTEKLLPEIDYEYLDDKGFKYEVLRVGAELRVIIYDFEVPAAYTPRQATLILRLPSGYPQSNPDMFWTKPDVLLARGGYPNRADYHDPSADGCQRWSRHGEWRPGIDNLRTKLASVKRELESGQ